MKKTFRIQIKAKGKAPDFGLGKAVILTQDLEFDLPEEEYSSPIFIHNIWNWASKMIDDAVYADINEVDNNNDGFVEQI